MAGIAATGRFQLNNIKPQFLTSDWHLFHDKILDFCDRPFKDIDHMHRVLINNYNSTVPKDGVCYFGGDMGMSSFDNMKNIISKLNGTKVLILGNHDKNVNAAYRMGFDVVVYGAIFWIANQQVTFTHCPLKDTYREDTSKMKSEVHFPNWHGESRKKFQRYIIPNWGQFHLHGHGHSPNKGQSEVKLGRQWDIGVDGNNYYPVSFRSIESWVAKTVEKEKLDSDK